MVINSPPLPPFAPHFLPHKERECPELKKPAIGDVQYESRLFNSRAVYSCPHGYHVVGLQSRVCQGDGNWAGSEPACKQNSEDLFAAQIHE